MHSNIAVAGVSADVTDIRLNRISTYKLELALTRGVELL